jgi:hypothetical protein
MTKSRIYPAEGGFRCLGGYSSPKLHLKQRFNEIARQRDEILALLG